MEELVYTHIPCLFSSRILLRTEDNGTTWFRAQIHKTTLYTVHRTLFCICWSSSATPCMRRKKKRALSRRFACQGLTLLDGWLDAHERGGSTRWCQLFLFCPLFSVVGILVGLCQSVGVTAKMFPPLLACPLGPESKEFCPSVLCMDGGSKTQAKLKRKRGRLLLGPPLISPGNRTNPDKLQWAIGQFHYCYWLESAISTPEF